MTYQPSPAPAGGDPAIREYMTRELQRIADELAYYTGVAMLIQDTPSVNPQATTAWQKVTTWTRTLPVQEQRTIEPDLPNDALVLTRPGFYFLSWYLSADIAAQRVYDVALFVNGEPTDSRATQRQGGRIVGFAASAGDRLAVQNVPATLDLRYKADATAQFEIERAGATMIYLGD